MSSSKLLISLEIFSYVILCPDSDIWLGWPGYVSGKSDRSKPELPGKKKPENPNGPMDLSQAGKKGPDPLENIPDEDNKNKDDKGKK